MKILKIIIRIPFGIIGCLAMAAFIPFAALIFFPGGLMWALCGLSLFSPLISWLFKIDDLLGMTWKERLQIFIAPVWAPLLYGYQIIWYGDLNPGDMDQIFHPEE